MLSHRSFSTSSRPKSSLAPLLLASLALHAVLAVTVSRFLPSATPRDVIFEVANIGVQNDRLRVHGRKNTGNYRTIAASILRGRRHTVKPAAPKVL